MVAAESYGNQMNLITNYQERHFTPIVAGLSLSRPWLVLARLCLLLRCASLRSALRASLRLFKSVPDRFVTQVVATTTTFAPEQRPDAPARRQHPRSTMNKAG